MKEPIKAEGVIRIHCSNCEDEAYTCDNCQEYFREGQEIICLDSEILDEAGNEKHFCDMDCYNDWKGAAPLSKEAVKRWETKRGEAGK